MLSFQDQYQQVQRLSSDFSSDMLATIKMHLNEAKNMIQEDLGLEVVEEKKNYTSQANISEYDLHPLYWRMKSVKYNYGGYDYPLIEVESQDYWDQLNFTNPSASDPPIYFFINRPLGIMEATLELFPKPATGDNTIKTVQESKYPDMTADDYVDGVVTVTNNNQSLIGVGTAFTPAMVGRFFATTTDKVWYRIEAYVSPTELTLNKKFAGLTASGQTYRIVEAMAVPESLHSLPIYWALSVVYMIKGDNTNQVKYRNFFDDGMKRAKERIGAGKTTGQVIKAKRYNLPITNPNFTPRTIS